MGPDDTTTVFYITARYLSWVYPYWNVIRPTVFSFVDPKPEDLGLTKPLYISTDFYLKALTHQADSRPSINVRPSVTLVCLVFPAPLALVGLFRLYFSQFSMLNWRQRKLTP